MGSGCSLDEVVLAIQILVQELDPLQGIVGM